MDKWQDEVVMDDIQTSEFQVEETEIVEHELDIVTTCCKPCSLKVSDECKICKQAGADITGQLQVGPMLYTLIVTLVT